MSPGPITPASVIAASLTAESVTGELRVRCAWVGSAPPYRAYHDDEWGRELHGDRELFERLSLEGFQSGLSWLTILRKRPAFREAFAGFDIAQVAGFDESDVTRLLGNAGIVRNRAKIRATISNAQAIVHGAVGLDQLLWSFAPPPRTMVAVVPSTSPESTAMARELRRRGLTFVGPRTAYALMQAVGMVNDHQRGCWLAGAQIGD